MIFYFTGTGNSFYIAKNISENNNEILISISEEMMKNKNEINYNLKENEIIGFVFPVYAWGPPRIVLDFIKKLKFKNFSNNYVFTVVTCGENIGSTIDLLKKELNKINLKLDSGFSIRMPNNYIIMGNVDSKEEEEIKLKNSEERLSYINRIIKDRKVDFYDYKKGPLPAFLTKSINSLFNNYALSTDKFYATDECISCKLCEKVCSVGSIKVDKKPIWDSKCTQCLACINRCPKRAIQYGKGTIKKGRYVHPRAFNI